LMTVISGGSMVVDSRYDLKRARLKTAGPATAERGSIIVTRTDASTTEQRVLEFDMLVEVGGTVWSTLAKGILAGILLATPQVLAALQNPNLPADARSIVVAVAGAFGLATGIFAAFAFKKPV